jgi:hypothetical protein
MAQDDLTMREGRRKMQLRSKMVGGGDPSAEERHRAGVVMTVSAVVLMAVFGYLAGGVVFALLAGGAVALLLGTLRWLFR